MKEQFRKQAERIVSKSGLGQPFPENLDFSNISPFMFIDRYAIDYIHSLGQDSPFFMGIKNKKLLSTRCKPCGSNYGTPRGHCESCGRKCEWFELPQEGRVHAFTVCHFGSEAFLDETPYVLILVEFDGVATRFLSRLKGVDVHRPMLEWIGMSIEARFSRRASRETQPSVTDVYFVPAK